MCLYRSILFFTMIFVLCFVPAFSGFALEPKHKIYHMAPDKIVAYIKSTKGQKKVILQYASWCPHCRAVMPKMIQLEQFRKGSVIAISTDQDAESFIRYINEYDDIPFPVVLLKRGRGDGLERLNQAMMEFGIVPPKGIPNMTLMDEKNRVVEQGNFKQNMDHVAEFLFDKVKRNK